MNSNVSETTTRRNPLDGLSGVLAILGLALLVRWLYLSQVRRLLLFREATGDAAQYLGLSREVLKHGIAAPPGEPWFQAPFYPWYLAMTVPDAAQLLLPRLLQFLAGALGTLAVWDTSRRIAGPRAALISGLGAAVYGPAIFFEGELLSITWALLFFQIALWAFIVLETGGSLIFAFLAGLGFGLSGLAQPNVLLVPAVMTVGLVISTRRARVPTTVRPHWSRPLLFAAGLAVVLGPVVWRNRVQTGEWILVSTNGGVNFFIGNNAGADGSFSIPAAEPLLNRSEGLSVSSIEAASTALGRTAGPSEASSYWFRRGLADMARDPLSAAGLLARKTLLFLGAAELPNHYDIRFFQARVPILRFLPGFLLLMPLAVWGALALRRSPAAGPLLIAGAAYAASVILFFVTDRYRLPVIAVLFPLAGAGLSDLIGIFRARRPREMIAGSAVVLLFLVLGAFPLMDTTPALAHMHNLVGTLHYQKNELGAARQEFERAVTLSPHSADALNNLGRVALLEKNIAEAERNFRRAIDADQRLPEAYFNLEELERNRGRPGDALRVLADLEARVPGARAGWAPAILFRRGLNHTTLGDTATARSELEEAIRLKPDLGGAWAGLGGIQAAAGELEAAWNSFTAAARHSPAYFGHPYNAGLVAERRGDYPAALNAYNRALELAPERPEIRTRIAVVKTVIQGQESH